jgi:hypothetical protein
MKSLLYIGAIALSLCTAAPVQAQFASATPEGARSLIAPTSGYTYFNRPGATFDNLSADVEACDVTVSLMNQPIQTSGAGAAYGLVGVLTDLATANPMQRSAQRRSKASLYENCMVLRGWRVVRVNDALGQELDAARGGDHLA